MPQSDALLRHRELTQEVYNIGDEVAEYIEHLAQAIADYDEELVVDCHAEFELIIDEATVRALPTSSGGVMGGSASAAATIVVPESEVGRVLTLDRRETPIKLVAVGGSPEKDD